MANTLRLKVNEQPTMFTKEMAIGGLAGALLPFSLIAAAAGVVIGGLVGKSRMEKEQQQGRVVSDKPSFWNKSTAIGGLIGLQGGALLGGVAVLASVAIIGAATPAAAAIGLLAGVTTFAGSVIGGTYLGGKSGQNQERKEYETAALQQQAERQQTRGKVQERSTGLEPEMQRDFTAMIEQQRARSTQQER